MNQVNQDTVRISDAATEIKKHSEISDVFNAMCANFAGRQRTKETLTVRALTARMEQAGYGYTKEDYANELMFLSKLGIGTLKRDNKGHIQALTDLKVTLQSIGQACATAKNLKQWRKQRRFKKLPHLSNETPKLGTPKKMYTANLVVNIEGRPIKLSSVELAPEELGEFMIEFSHMTKKIKPV